MDKKKIKPVYQWLQQTRRDHPDYTPTRVLRELDEFGRYQIAEYNELATEEQLEAIAWFVDTWYVDKRFTTVRFTTKPITD